MILLLGTTSYFASSSAAQNNHKPAPPSEPARQEPPRLGWPPSGFLSIGILLVSIFHLSHLQQEQLPQRASRASQHDWSTAHLNPLGSRESCPEANTLRPVTGTVFGKRLQPADAYGELKVQNNSDADAVVSLVDVIDNKPGKAVYVRAGDNSSLEGIPDGTYFVLYQLGSGWLSKGGFCNAYATK